MSSEHQKHLLEVSCVRINSTSASVLSLECLKCIGSREATRVHHARYFYCLKTRELNIHRLSSATVPVNKDHSKWLDMQRFCTIEPLCYLAANALCVIWRGGTERQRMAQNTARSHAIGQINVAHRLGLHNSAAWMLQTILSEMWANCNSDAPHKQGHSAQNVTRYTIWNGVLSIIQSAMVPILICITITGYAELSQSCLPRISLPERVAPIKKFQLQSSVGEVASRENNLQGVFWGDHSPRRDWVSVLAHNVNTSVIL